MSRTNEYRANCGKELDHSKKLQEAFEYELRNADNRGCIRLINLILSNFDKIQEHRLNIEINGGENEFAFLYHILISISEGCHLGYFAMWSAEIKTIINA
jgi:hypothetical protein